MKLLIILTIYLQNMLNLKKIRKDKFLKIKELSELTGINRNKISRIEKNIDNARFCDLVKISEALGLELRFLIK